MSSTKDIVTFLLETRNGLSSLTERLTGIRYDLIGSRVEPSNPVPPPPPAPTNVYELSLTDAVEYLAGDINASMNRFLAEVEHLQQRVNHKEVAQPSNTKATL